MTAREGGAALQRGRNDRLSVPGAAGQRGVQQIPSAPVVRIGHVRAPAPIPGDRRPGKYNQTDNILRFMLVSWFAAILFNHQWKQRPGQLVGNLEIRAGGVIRLIDLGISNRRQPVRLDRQPGILCLVDILVAIVHRLAVPIEDHLPAAVGIGFGICWRSHIQPAG